MYWFVGGTDAATYAKAEAEGRLNDLPVNHSPHFAPVLHPTLSTGVEAMTAAALAWSAARHRGGVARDVLLAEIPAVLRSDLYAAAALAGAATVVVGSWLHLPIAVYSLGGGLLCFGLRAMAVHRGWQLPVARQGQPPAPPDGS